MKYYCKYCGASDSSISSLTFHSCKNSSTGKHVPYEGSEKSKYYCKYCGASDSSIRSLTFHSCKNSSNGHHVPM